MALDLKSRVVEANKKLSQFYNDGNMNGLVNEVYSEDCVVMPQGSPELHGRKAAEDLFNKMYNELGAKSVQFETVEVGEMEANKFYERGHYTLYSADKSTFDVGKYAVVWKEDAKSNNIQIYIDIFNSNKK